MYTRCKQTTIKIKQEIKQLNMETARQWNTKRQKKTETRLEEQNGNSNC